jgi:putative peptidoglycan lipid II flippase
MSSQPSDSASGGNAKGAKPSKGVAGAVAAAAGIFLSRIAGLIRERVFGHYLGTGAAADAYKAAVRIPNLLQNLLGEGVLSASFIPVYSRLLSKNRTDEAALVARTIATLLILAASVVAIIGVVAADPLVSLLAAGFSGETRALTVRLVQVLFPGVALLVISAWCLGVLNSHRKFFLAYAAPVIWNVTLIAACIVAGRRFIGGDGADIVLWLAWGAALGSLLQFAIQLPSVWPLVRPMKPALAVSDASVRQTVRAFGPVLLGRGSVQISAYIDGILASYLREGIVSAMAVANTLYLLPISLFGMAISAAELPAMSSIDGTTEQAAEKFRIRLQSSLRQVVFLVVPSAIAFVAIGPWIVGLLFQTGEFNRDSTWMVWVILSGSAVGLTANTQGRLLASALYSLGDTKSPLYAALTRMGITFVAGWSLVFPLRDWFGYSSVWGAFGLTASAGVAAWVEFAMLRRWLARRIGKVPVPHRLVLVTTVIACVAGAAAYGCGKAIEHLGARLWIAAPITIGLYCALYVAGGLVAKVPETREALRRVLRRKS